MILPQSIEFPGRLFKIEADPSGNALVVEVRDEGERQVGMYRVDLEEGGECLAGPVMEWWCGLEAVYESGLLLHRFEDPNLPVHRGLEWWSLPEFELQWRAPGARLVARLADRLWLRLADEREVLVNLESGVEIEAVNGENRVKWVTAAESFDKLRFAGLRIPSPVSVDQFESLSIFEEMPSATGTVSALEVEERTLLAWHCEQAEGGFALWLAVLRNGEVESMRCLEKDMKKLSPEPFFVLYQRVLWMEGTSTLNWLPI